MESLKIVSVTPVEVMISVPPDLNASCLRMAPFVYAGVLVFFIIICFLFLLFIVKIFKIKITKSVLLLISFVLVEIFVYILFKPTAYYYFLVPVLGGCI